MSGIVSSNTHLSSYMRTGTHTASNGQYDNAASSKTTVFASATQVTLSEAAKAALASSGRESETEIAEKTAGKLSGLLETSGQKALIKDGKLLIDLSSLTRAQLFAISSNSGNLFSADEQKAADFEQQRRFDEALKGGYSLMRVTGSYADLYDRALEYLDGASQSEKATVEWRAQFSALEKAKSYLEGMPGKAPAGIKDDPVASYLERLKRGEIKVSNSLDVYASQARSVLDRYETVSERVAAMSKFGSKSLSAIAKNEGGKFSTDEAGAAKKEMKARVGAAVQEAFQLAGKSGDVTDFSRRIIAQYSSMSADEREAAGLDQEYYKSIMQNYETSMKISQAFTFGGASTGRASLLDFL